MTVDITQPTAQDTLTQEEIDLYGLLMDYRATLGLPSIPLSKALTITAGRHVMDTRENIWATGTVLPAGANLHSWSNAPYYGDHRDPAVMWYAPQRLGTGYASEGFEISAAGYSDIHGALAAWKNSPGHNAVIAQTNGWQHVTYQAIGIGVETSPGPGPNGGRIYHVWFGAAADASGAPVSEAAGRVGGSGNDALMNGRDSAVMQGLEGSDTIRAGDGADTLIGGAGDDLLEGGAGRDRMDGGGGYDIASYHSAVAAVTLSLHAETGTGGDAEGDIFVSIESLLGSGHADGLIGSDDHNIIEGAGGADTVDGRLGNDWISFENAAAAIAVNLDTSSGWAGDAAADSITGIENIRGSRFADYLYGDWQANILRGDEGADVLYGAANSDTIYYSTSPGAVRVDLSTNSASGGHAAGDTLVSVENVFATPYTDTLIGDSASNTLVGWLGRDILTGNGGNDIFRWSAPNESGVSAETRDLVTDFWRVHGDLLDVSGIDARLDIDGEQAFAFIGYLPFSAPGQLRYTFDGLGNTLVELRTASSGTQMQIALTGTLYLEAGDFLL